VRPCCLRTVASGASARPDRTPGALVTRAAAGRAQHLTALARSLYHRTGAKGETLAQMRNCSWPCRLRRRFSKADSAESYLNRVYLGVAGLRRMPPASFLKKPAAKLKFWRSRPAGGPLSSPTANICATPSPLKSVNVLLKWLFTGHPARTVPVQAGASRFSSRGNASAPQADGALLYRSVRAT